MLDDERKNEPKIVLPYPETLEEIKKTPKKVVTEEKKESVDKKMAKKEVKEEESEILSKQITKKDLKKSNSKLLIALASILTILVVIITVGFVLIPYLTKTQKISIPDVTGYTVEDAIKALQDAGFTVATEQEHIASESVPYGKVAKTAPLAYTIRTTGTEITLWISEGDTKITLDDFTGKNFYEIKGQLEAKGVNIQKETKDTKEKDIEENTIIDQNPKPGEKVSKGDYVFLYIPNVDKYPNFANGNYTFENVVDYLEKYNVTINKIEQVSNKTPGLVIGQSRAEGTQIVSGTSITITVAIKGDSTDEETCDGLC